MNNPVTDAISQRVFRDIYIKSKSKLWPNFTKEDFLAARWNYNERLTKGGSFAFRVIGFDDTRGFKRQKSHRVKNVGFRICRSKV